MVVASFSRIMHLDTGKKNQEWFEEHDKELKVLGWSPNSPNLNPKKIGLNLSVLFANNISQNAQIHSYLYSSILSHHIQL